MPAGRRITIAPPGTGRGAMRDEASEPRWDRFSTVSPATKRDRTAEGVHACSARALDAMYRGWAESLRRAASLTHQYQARPSKDDRKEPHGPRRGGWHCDDAHAVLARLRGRAIRVACA